MSEFEQMLKGSEPVLALAPMQDVTDLAFWNLVAEYGAPDVYFTEYFRVHPTSNLEKPILRSITDNTTGRPAIAQMIGNDVPSLVRTAKELQRYPIVAIDLNLGCPAPVVYRKCAGGGLLREPERVDAILGALREAIAIKFTVKTRIGFESPDRFEELLAVFARHSIDMLTVHGRTVKEMYWSAVHYDYIARAVDVMPCPVLANGNVYSAAKAEEVLDETGAAGLMIGRGVIRNPWLFRQIREHRAGGPMFVPTGREVMEYARRLFEATRIPGAREKGHVQKLKKYMNYFGLGVEPTGGFLHKIRRVENEKEFFAVCSEYLDHDEAMPLVPFEFELNERDVVAGCHG